MVIISKSDLNEMAVWRDVTRSYHKHWSRKKIKPCKKGSRTTKQTLSVNILVMENIAHKLSIGMKYELWLNLSTKMSTATMLRTTIDAIKSRKIRAFDEKECNLHPSDQPIPKPLLGYFYRRPEHDDPAKECLNIEDTLQYKPCVPK